MTIFILGLVIFFGTHVFAAVRPRDPERDIRKKMGYGPYMGLYTLVSLTGFVMLCYGFGATRGAGQLYVPPDWGRHVNFAFMPPALILLAASQLPAGRIRKWAKHPMLVSVKLWATGHLFANGELNAVLLFGSFLAFAVFDRIMLKRRGDTGPAPDAPVSLAGDIGAVAIGLAAYAAIVWYLHPILFGVPAVLPR